MAKNNILSKLGQIVSGIAGKKPSRPEAPAQRVLEGSDAPDNARAITEALRAMGGGPAQQPPAAAAPTQTRQKQQQAASAQKSASRQQAWLGGIAQEYREKAGAAREAIGRAGAGARPTRAEGVAETKGMSQQQRIERLEGEGLSVSQQTTAMGKETKEDAVTRVEVKLLDLREQETQALAENVGKLMIFSTALGRATIIGKILLKLDLAFRGATEVVKEWSDGLLASKENLREYNGAIANGMAVLEAAQMNRDVKRGIATQDSAASYMRQKRGFDDAAAKMSNDFENLKTRVATVGMWFAKWGARIFYYLSPITYISKFVELIAGWFGFGAEEEEAPPVLYMQFLGMVADGKFDGPHQERPAKK